MNILKKFFLVSLFCSLFVVSAYATELEWKYTVDVVNFVNNNQTLLDNLHSYISGRLFDTGNGSSYKYDSNLIIWDFHNINNGFVYGIIASNEHPSNNIYFQYSSKHTNYDMFTENPYNKITISFSLSYYKFDLNDNYEVVNHSYADTLYSSSGATISNIFRYYESNALYNNSNTCYFDMYFDTHFLGTSDAYGYVTVSDWFEDSGFNLKVGDTVYSSNQIEPFKTFFDNMNTQLNQTPIEPTYSYTSTVLDNGNVELTFTFENYDSDSSYGFTIENELSGEDYGVENPFSSIFPNIVPFGNSYSITIPYDTYLYVTLAKYNKLEDSTLYFREEIFTDVIDVNNIVFSNPSNPYFSIDYQSKKFIQGRFSNTQKNDSCFVKFSNNLESRQVSCSESFTINYDFNGFLTFYVKRNNSIIYNRNINVLGNDSLDYPYITYNVEKQDFYSIVTFNVINDNYDINMSYRYSLDNGVTWSDYQLIDKTPASYSINVFSNSNVIFEIANVRSPNNIIVYDSKSVYVILDISTASGLNSSTDNIIDKFISLISLNDNLINYINLLWNNIKNSKLFLIIMLPFISSIICAIIYLIRRK